MRSVALPALLLLALSSAAYAQAPGGASARSKSDSVASPEKAPRPSRTAAAHPDSAGGNAAASADTVNAADPASQASEDSAKAPDPLTYTRPVFIYDPGGKRDPFNSLSPKAEKEEKKIKGLLDYEKAVVRGIVKTDSEAYALIIDGDSYAHVLRKNDKVANGYVTEVTDDGVFLHIIQYGRSMRIILRMEAAKQTVRGTEDGGEIVKRPGIDLSFEQGEQSESGVAVDDIVIPERAIRTVEDVWFGTDGDGKGDSSGGASTLIGPAGGAAVLFPQLFRWTKAADDSLYTLVISEDGEFRSRLILKEGIVSPPFVYEENPGLENGKRYYWKVVALKRSGTWVHSRNHLSFMLMDTIPRGTTDEKK